MKRSSGENAPVARSSRSQASRCEICTEGRRLAYAFSSACDSAGVTKFTNLPPQGLTNVEVRAIVKSAAPFPEEP